MFCNLADPQINESSGIVASVMYDDVLYTHNDSGDTARFFAIDRSCHTRATFVLPGVQARDWEDISRGPGDTLWLGDIGDNSATRTNGVLVHRVHEPAPAHGVVRLASVSFRLRYPDGPHDAEALMVHPRTGQLLIVTKSFAGGEVFAAPLPLQAGAPNLLARVGKVSIPEVTAGDISPDGSRVVLRNYTAAYEWDVRGDDVAAALQGEPTRIPLPRSPQGEGISYSPDGRSLIVSSEGVGAPVQEVDATPPTPPTPPAARSAAPSTARSAAPAVPGRSAWTSPWLRAVLAAGALLVVGVIGLHRTRIRHGR